MPPVKKRSLRRYTFDPSKFDSLSFRRSLHLTASPQPSKRASVLPFGTAGFEASLAQDEPICPEGHLGKSRSTVSPEGSVGSDITDSAGRRSEIGLEVSPRGKEKADDSCSRYSAIVPNLDDLESSGTTPATVEVDYGVSHTGLPSLPLFSANDDVCSEKGGFAESCASMSATTTTPSSGGAGSSPPTSISASTSASVCASTCAASGSVSVGLSLRSQRVAEKVRSLVVRQRQSRKRELAQDRLLAVRIRTRQLHRKAFFAAPRSERERLLRITSVRERIRSKQQIRLLLLSVTAEIDRIRTIDRLKQTEEALAEEREHQKAIGIQLYTAKRQTLAVLYKQMLERRQAAQIPSGDRRLQKKDVHVEEQIHAQEEQQLPRSTAETSAATTNPSPL